MDRGLRVRTTSRHPDQAGECLCAGSLCVSRSIGRLQRLVRILHVGAPTTSIDTNSNFRSSARFRCRAGYAIRKGNWRGPSCPTATTIVRNICVNTQVDVLRAKHMALPRDLLGPQTLDRASRSQPYVCAELRDEYVRLRREWRLAYARSSFVRDTATRLTPDECDREGVTREGH